MIISNQFLFIHIVFNISILLQETLEAAYKALEKTNVKYKLKFFKYLIKTLSNVCCFLF